MADDSQSWLEKMLGDNIVDAKGAVSTKDIVANNDVVSFYVSAHWCPPCRAFTPELSKVYKAKHAEKKWEIIFISSDKEDKAFNDYFGEMPWKALKYSEREIKNKVARKYGVAGIPMLIMLDAKTGKVIKKNARGDVSQDQELLNFPWSPPSFWDIMKDVELVGKDAAAVKMSDIKATKDYIGIYFSAHWCPPCRAFTPQLAKWYDEKVKDGKFEFIFNSWDKTEEQFNEYSATMPFPSRKYDDKNVRTELDKLYEIQGIPSLVVLDAKTGKVITADGRSKVASAPDDFPWRKVAASYLDEGCIDALNSSPCMIAFCNTDTKKAIMEAMKPVAQPLLDKMIKEDENGMDIEFIVDSGEHPISAKVRDLLSVKDSELLCVMNLQAKKLHYYEDADFKEAGQITKDVVQKFLDQYNDKTAKERDIVM